MSRIRDAAAQIVRPLQQFTQTETTGGVLLLAAALAALLWINLPNDSYIHFWARHVDLNLDFIELDLSLAEWVNDGLMAIFFFVVGLEIKRELLRGELAGARRAALPVAAAIGGMVVPAAIFLAINAGSPGRDGWGIPMATDIAFSIGLLALLGSRVPMGLKVFLLALAIVDDIGAILVIAVFYTDSLAIGWLALGIAMFAATVALGRLGIRTLTLYLAIALVAWLAFHESGVHATVAGVALGLLTPIDPHYDVPRLSASAGQLLRQVTEGRAEGTREGDELAEASLRDLEELARESQSPLERLEGALHPWTSYVIVPIFALANAGVEMSGSAWSDALTSRASWGVALGLMLGKPIGIMLACYVAVRLGLAVMPNGARWPQLVALSMVAGIGFTVSLFVTNLAFDDGGLIQEAKIGVLAGSGLVSGAGLIALWRVLPVAQADEG